MTLMIITGMLINLLIHLPAAAEKPEPHPQQLNIYDSDVTGGNAQETVKLVGTSLASDSDYNATIKSRITNNDGGDWQIHYEGGYNPEIQFHDFNHNDVNDLLYQSNTGNGDLHHYHLHTFENGQTKEMKLPEQKSVKAKFKDDFQIAVQIDHKQKPAIIDVTDNASDYIQMGLYKENGEVKSDNLSPIINPIAKFEPVQVSHSQGYGLKSRQQISGAHRTDKLGVVETLWYYKNDRWIILQTDWKPAE